MATLAPLDDINTYMQYYTEAIARQKALQAQYDQKQLAAQSLFGKPTALDSVYPFRGDIKQQLSSGDAAYDALQNIKQSEIEDQATRARMALQKIQMFQK